MAPQKFFLIKSNYNEKYLEYVKEPMKVRGLNKFSGKIPESSSVLYKLEMARNWEGLVHIKCCYNNNYLVRRSEDQDWIASTADKPEEDKSKWSCTLFEIFVIGTNTFRLRHVQLGHYACLGWLIYDPAYGSCLRAESDEVDDDQRDVFTIEVVDRLNNGIPSGVSSCNFKYETKEEKLAAASNLIEQLASEPI
ncbi:hypothetical protein LguiA_004337 [Lonicera macranthoides]